MVNKIVSGAVDGVDGLIVVVEVDISHGLPGTDVVGLPDSAVKESKERVRAAIRNSGFRVPANRITINLAPASTKKAGAAFDLPMAVGILCGMGVIPGERARRVFITGELSLDGKIQPVDGVLSMVDNAVRSKIRHFIVPFENEEEARLVEGARVVGIKSLSDLARFFNSGVPPAYERGQSPDEAGETGREDAPLDFGDVKGQEHAKRALEAAAAGGHNVLMVGPPGSGKTMLAKRLPTILGGMTFDESIEVTKIYSVAGLLKNTALITRRPFRSPHHTTSYSALAGGGKIPKPGEISLAHNGVLFLDEFPEFYKDARESLRQPMEDGEVTISRALAKTTFPSRFMLVCAMNPCPCGFYGEGGRCSCSAHEVSNYRDRISGPLMDRIDIHIEVPRVDFDKLAPGRKAESSADIRKRVEAALEIQKERYKGLGISANARLTEPMIERFCRLNDTCSNMMKRAYEVMNMSARAYHKTLKVARTLADLDTSANVGEKHLAEALQYRQVDKKRGGYL